MSIARQYQAIKDAWSAITPKLAYEFRIGAMVLRLNFTDEAFAKKMTQAFAHLPKTNSQTPDLTINIWDTHSTQKPLPRLDWETINRNGYHGAHDGNIYLHYFDSIAALSALNLTEKQAFYVVKDWHHLPWWVSGSPLQVILHAWFRAHNMQLTHTAAVGNEAGAILLTGKGGSGKSTTTLACIRAGLNYLGEDYCLLSPEPIPTVYSVYQSAKWTGETRQYFPEYESHIANPGTADQEKALVYYQDMFATQIRCELPIKAIVSLHVAKQPLPKILTHSSKAALKDLMLSTLMQLPFYQTHTMDLLQQLVMQLPCYQLSLGEDFAANSKAIYQLIEQCA